MSHRRLPRRETVVGRCRRCAVAFGARPAEVAAVREVRRVHEAICPGGDRRGEVVWPMRALDDDPAAR